MKDKEGVEEFVQFLAKKKRDSVREVERQAFLQLTWVLGHQNFGYDVASSELVDNADYNHSAWWRVNAIENRLLPLVEGRLSKRLARLPMWTVKPATSDEEDDMVSQAQRQVLRHYWRNALDMDTVLWEALWWAEVCNTSFVVCTWDPNAGPTITIKPEDFNLRFSPEEESALDTEDFFGLIFGENASNEGERVSVGDAVVEVRTIFETFVDPAARRIDKAQYVQFEHFQSIDSLEMRYGLSKTGDLDPGASVPDSPFHARILQLTGGLNETESDVPTEDQVLVQELWVQPTPSLPDGLHAVFGQGRELQLQPIPYEHRHIPVVAFHGVTVPFSTHGTSKVEQLMEAQSSFNETRSLKREYRNLHVYPKILDPNVGSIDEDAWVTAFGERVLYTPGHKPEYLVPPPMPNYLSTLEQDDVQAFQDLGDLHEVSTAQAPEGVKSGRAILALQAQDEIRLGPPIRKQNKQIARLGKFLLSNLRQFVTEERLIQIASDDLEFEVGLWRQISGFVGSDLVGPNESRGIDYFRVETETESELPLSPEGQRVVIDGLLERQVLRPDQDRELILRLNGLGSADPIMQQARIHRSMAVRENRMMASGADANVEKFHNHAAHLQVHLHYMNSSEFLRLPPESQQLYNTHMTRHQLMATVELLRPQLMVQQGQEIAQQIIQEEMQALTGGNLPETVPEPGPPGSEGPASGPAAGPPAGLPSAAVPPPALG